ncbi:MAG TPA: hypothetical protein HA359_01940 [Candidatus Poseidoniaceae archaeon]|nr:MAG TPA: hypothetical protein D7H84_01940 [Candidatus Poseidoniales archaeon]HII22997.1 hypothetical protein [Candidatus Poseidoniaceae archaeon]
MESDSKTISNSSEDILSQFEEQNISMVSLVKTLLSTSTMPHIILITLLSTILYIVAKVDSLTIFSSMVFASLSVSYCVTALLSKNPKISSWITLPDDEQKIDSSKMWNTLSKFRICLFPLSVAGLIFLIISFTTGENGVISDANKSIPLILGMLFVIWSIVQGTSFSMWASSTSAKPSSKSTKSSSIRFSLIVILSTIGLVSIILAAVFYQLENLENKLGDSIVLAIPFCLLAIGLTIGSISYSWKFKKLASMKPNLQKFSSRWTIICHLFITWHLLTIWRQNFLTPSNLQVFFEEITLMIFTVFVAIWSMTSKGYRSKLKLITEENALTWGLGFGYAYAGSVAMLTTFFDDIVTVMSIGHGVVIVTVIFIHRLILSKIIGNDDSSVEVKRIMDNSKKSNHEEESNVEDISNEIPNNKQNDDENDEVWQEDSDVDWDAEQEQPQIDNIEWDETIDLD